MMSDGGDLSFRDDFAQGKPKGYMHWNGQDIFGNEKIDIEFINKFMNTGFELPPCPVNHPGDGWAAAPPAENLLVD